MFTMRGMDYVLFNLMFVILGGIYCDNVTSKYPSKNFNTRQHRLLTFNTEKDGVINVDLEFSVPFLTIPTKPSADVAHGALANLNVGAVILAGMMAFGAAIIIPAAYHLFNKRIGFNYGDAAGAASDIFSKKIYRSDGEPSGLYKIMATLDEALSEHNIDSTSCMQRAVCWTVKNSNRKLANGEATSADKIIDGLATNSWIMHFVSGSVFQAAIDSGLERGNCAKEYSQCKVDQNSIHMFGKHFINSIYNRK